MTSNTTVVATMRRRRKFFFDSANLMLVCVSPLQQSPADEVIRRFTIPVKVCLFEHIIDEGGRGAIKGISSIQCFSAHLMRFQGVGFHTCFRSEQTQKQVGSSRLPAKLLEPTHTASPSTTIRYSLTERFSVLTSFPLAIGSHPTCTYARQTIIIISASQVHVPVGIHTANHPALHNKLKYSPPHILTK